MQHSHGNTSTSIANPSLSQIIEYYSSIIERNPEDSYAYYKRGATYANHGNYSLALRDYTYALRISPENSVAHYERGRIYANLGNDTQAIGSYSRAIEINPQNGNAYIARGHIYTKQGNHLQASHDYNCAERIKSGINIAYGNHQDVPTVSGSNQCVVAAPSNHIFNAAQRYMIPPQERNEQQFSK